MKKFITTVGLGLVLLCNTAQAQSTLNAVTILNWAWGTNAVTSTASGNTGIAAFGTNLVDGGGIISSMSIANNTAFPVDFALFDAPRTPPRAVFTNDVWNATVAKFTGTVFWVHVPNGSGYGLVTWTQALGNVTKIVTNFSGVTTTNTFTNALLSGYFTNACATNNYRRMYFVTLPANATFTPNLGAGIYFGSGITITNGSGTTFGNAASNITVSINYDPAL